VNVCAQHSRWQFQILLQVEDKHGAMARGEERTIAPLRDRSRDPRLSLIFVQQEQEFYFGE
jgi:hypothetical protein